MHNQTKNMIGEQKVKMGQSLENTTNASLNAESLNQNPYINAQNTQMKMGNTDINFNQQKMNAEMQNPYMTQKQDGIFNSIDSKDFLKGALIGVGVTYLLTNENIQNSIMKVVAKGVSLFQSGVEEIKEKYEDAKAEIEAEKDEQ